LELVNIPYKTIIQVVTDVREHAVDSSVVDLAVSHQVMQRSFAKVIQKQWHFQVTAHFGQFFDKSIIALKSNNMKDIPSIRVNYQVLVFQGTSFQILKRHFIIKEKIIN